MVMTAATPITMPSTVRKLRSRLRRMAQASTSVVREHLPDLLAVSLPAVRCGFDHRLDPAVDEAHDAPGVVRHVGLVRDHQAP